MDAPRTLTTEAMTSIQDKKQLSALPALVRGAIVDATPSGDPVVAFGDGETAVATSIHMQPTPDWARCRGLAVFLAFEDGDAGRPIILGLAAAPPATLPVPPQDVVRMESGKEMVLECGLAKIALRADGRIEIRGGHLISRSSGPNKIKGGSVHIN